MLTYVGGRHDCVVFSMSELTVLRFPGIKVFLNPGYGFLW